MTMSLATIKITWMDGYSRTYADVTTSTRDGVLHVHQYGDIGDVSAITAEWHFPISNIRMWKPVKIRPQVLGAVRPAAQHRVQREEHRAQQRQPFPVPRDMAPAHRVENERDREADYRYDAKHDGHLHRCTYPDDSDNTR